MFTCERVYCGEGVSSSSRQFSTRPEAKKTSSPNVSNCVHVELCHTHVMSLLVPKHNLHDRRGCYGNVT